MPDTQVTPSHVHGSVAMSQPDIPVALQLADVTAALTESKPDFWLGGSGGDGPQAAPRPVPVTDTMLVVHGLGNGPHIKVLPAATSLVKDVIPDGQDAGTPETSWLYPRFKLDILFRTDHDGGMVPVS